MTYKFVTSFLKVQMRYHDGHSIQKSIYQVIIIFVKYFNGFIQFPGTSSSCPPPATDKPKEKKRKTGTNEVEKAETAYPPCNKFEPCGSLCVQ